MTSVLAIDGSPRGGGRTRLVLDAVLAGARELSATTDVVELSGQDESVARAIAAASRFDAFVLGAPAYRAAPASPIKVFLDGLPRGFWGETEAPITGRAVAIVMTGASDHHYLALDGLRSALAGFFAAQVLSPGVYVSSAGFQDGRLGEEGAAFAAAQGRALVALSEAIAGSEHLRVVKPQL
ncbi:NADPH-dependent FMN reductase [uncultured Amnibacterium sp.]|uniref:NADPH-dependent FMN reductase n=1 Tax=uncultured Amnibacterium sp. TaxID=1631851 RepID=UPI0035CB7CD9